MRKPEAAKRLADIAAETVGSSPGDQDAVLRKQIAQYRPVIHAMRPE